MSDIVPFILAQEHALIKQEICGRPLSVIFDGTCRLGEGMTIIVRFISPDWSIQQRLIRFELLAKSLAVEEVARVLICALSTQYGTTSEQVVAAMRDCVSVNNVAMCTLKVLYPSLIDVGCFSHTLDRVGERFRIPHALDFVSRWISLFSRSFKAQLLWKERTGCPVRSYSAT